MRAYLTPFATQLQRRARSGDELQNRLKTISSRKTDAKKNGTSNTMAAMGTIQCNSES